MSRLTLKPTCDMAVEHFEELNLSLRFSDMTTVYGGFWVLRYPGVPMGQKAVWLEVSQLWAASKLEFR
jgi:hypothetical protein